MKKWSWTLAWFTKLASGSRPGCIVSKQTEASVQRDTAGTCTAQSS